MVPSIRPVVVPSVMLLQKTQRLNWEYRIHFDYSWRFQSFLDWQCTEDLPSSYEFRTSRELWEPRLNLMAVWTIRCLSYRQLKRLSCFGCRVVSAKFERSKAHRRVSVCGELRYACHHVTYRIKTTILPCCRISSGR